MRAVRKTSEEQYRLVMECRQSGLTDCDWCRENGININTFYAWVRRLRKETCHTIPDPGRHHADNGICVNEVVKVEILPEEQQELLFTVGLMERQIKRSCNTAFNVLMCF